MACDRHTWQSNSSSVSPERGRGVFFLSFLFIQPFFFLPPRARSVSLEPAAHPRGCDTSRPLYVLSLAASCIGAVDVVAHLFGLSSEQLGAELHQGSSADSGNVENDGTTTGECCPEGPPLSQEAPQPAPLRGSPLSQEGRRRRPSEGRRADPLTL